MWRYKHGVSKLKYLLLAVMVLLIIVLAMKLFLQNNLPVIEINSQTDIPANLRFVMETTVSDLPVEGELYKIKAKEYSDGEANSLAQAFGIADVITYNGDSNEWMAYQNGELLIINGATSWWFYRNLAASKNTYNINVAVPTDEEAIVLAKEYIAKLGIDTNSLNTIAVGSTIASDKTLQKGIYFYQNVNGHELLGPPQLIVTIGDKGQLEGITSYYYEYEADQIFRFKTIDQVMKELQSQQVVYYGPETVLSEAKIYDFNLAYCQSNDINLQHNYLVPVFLFNGEVETQGGPMQFSALVPAIKGITIN
ncbi:hypothetical protein V6C27_04605 [Peptococcaceae bacterium 1198_IL3148]